MLSAGLFLLLEAPPCPPPSPDPPTWGEGLSPGACHPRRQESKNVPKVSLKQPSRDGSQAAAELRPELPNQKVGLDVLGTLPNAGHLAQGTAEHWGVDSALLAQCLLVSVPSDPPLPHLQLWPE